jgi:hypothetical protein
MKDTMEQPPTILLGGRRRENFGQEIRFLAAI